MEHFTIKIDINWNLRYKEGENKRIVINEKSNAEFQSRTSESNFTDIWRTSESIQDRYSEWSKQVSAIAESIYLKKKKNKKEIKAVRMLRRRKKEIKMKFDKSTPEEKKILLNR